MSRRFHGAGLGLSLVTAALAVAQSDESPPESPPSESAYNQAPIRRRFDPLQVSTARTWLSERGISFQLDLVVFGQYADQVLSGDRWNGAFSYQVAAEWALTRDDTLGTGFLGASAFGTVGFNYETGVDPLSSTTGTISDLNGVDFPHEIILDEVYWRQSIDRGRLMFLGGMIDLANWFDLNRVANDSFSQFFSASLENNPTIPFPESGGFGAMMIWEPRHEFTLRAGVADSSSDNSEPWSTARADSVYGIVEFDLEYTLGRLGRGNMRISPWYATAPSSRGWGIALNLDQNLGHDNIIAFLRAGTGNPSAVDVEHAVSGGVAFSDLISPGDFLGFGASWSDPSAGNGLRSETLLELQYRFRISESIDITPDVQVIFNPAQNPTTSTIWVGGVRLALRF